MTGEKEISGFSKHMEYGMLSLVRNGRRTGILRRTKGETTTMTFDTSAFSEVMTKSLGAMTLEKLLGGLVTLIVCLVVIRIVTKIVKRITAKVNWDPRVEKYLATGVKAVLYILAALIVADVNKVAGQEIRALPFLHWWTFLGYFHAIGEGQLSAVVTIRDKLSRGKKLEEWEKDYYRENRKTVELQRRLSREEIREQERIQALLE